MLRNFINRHFEVGEKYLEFLRSPYVDPCEQCPKSTFICPKYHKTSKPMPDYSTDGYHYFPASKTPPEMNDKEREIDDFQPRAQLKKTKMKMIFKTFATHLCIIEKHLLLKYLNHLRYLKIKQEKGEQKNQLRKEQNQKSFSEYDWEELIYSGKLRTVTHNHLNKHLHHYSIEDLKKV